MAATAADRRAALCCWLRLAASLAPASVPIDGPWAIAALPSIAGCVAGVYSDVGAGSMGVGAPATVALDTGLGVHVVWLLPVAVAQTVNGGLHGTRVAHR
mmetsp:Transcript_30751/g.63440  ORF Transcript_30751/g.63440 Transcript_30751/m.63440 type:complete len:100 (+) Transcript_30751:125-424(+)